MRWLGFLLLALVLWQPGGATEERIPVSLFWLWGGQSRGVSPSDPLVQLMAADPTIEVREWSGLTLPGGAGRTPLLMSIAGQTAPDLYYSWFHIIRNDVAQGFIHPLNEWVGTDGNRDGAIDAAEAKWDGWAQLPALQRHVATLDGKVYGIPTPARYYMGVIYRLDLVRQAGLDPAKPPKTWDEFLYWSQKLTDPKTGMRGMALPCYGFTWLSWLYSAGGCPVMQVKVSPTTGKTYEFPMETVHCITPDTREDLTQQPTVWRAALGSEAAQRSVAFFHRLRWQKWLRDPETQEPVNLTEAQAAAGVVTLPSGRKLTFGKDDVIVGCIAQVGGPSSTVNWGEEMAKGKIAMTQWFFNDLSGYQKSLGINPDLLGVFPIPAGPGGNQVVQIQRHFAVMSEGVGRRPKVEREAVWKVLTALTSPQAIDEEVRRQVLSGFARFVNPRDLARLGFKDYLAEVPPSLRELYADLDAGKITTHTEPFMGFWVTMDTALNTNVLSLVTAESGERFDYVKALKEVEHTANTGTMFARNPKELAKYRPVAWSVFAVVALLVILFVGLIIKANLTAQTKTTAARAGVYRGWIPWTLLLPALGLIALWGYYPLARGLQMAFQDYHIIGKSPWVGLDNFIGIFLNPDFYIYVRQTLKFVILNLVFVFSAPIFLSLLLSEIPVGKVFWRSIFFLPQLTSGLVIALLWKLMYSSTETGLLNQVAGLFGQTAKDWLGDPATAMMCTIIPSVWAGMGMASLIYLAALKGIPEELYEAADLDGAGMWAKLRRITLPQLAPLIIINFVGAFIGTFQSMGNIFLLTFGGPGKETMVMGMAIWLEAYANLRFSVATSMAWILGSALIGFAYLQIRILRQVEFRRVEEV
jgi:ABC-type sugar transport system permease subunit/ABC-type glycerol-3-phosphate transport system substrate-binding protein